jgi:hypothetical protein
MDPRTFAYSRYMTYRAEALQSYKQGLALRESQEWLQSIEKFRRAIELYTQIPEQDLSNADLLKLRELHRTLSQSCECFGEKMIKEAQEWAAKSDKIISRCKLSETSRNNLIIPKPISKSTDSDEEDPFSDDDSRALSPLLPRLL